MGKTKFDTSREAIGLRIKDLRKKRKFSQTFVASNLYITQAAYSRIENSSNGIVVDHIIRLSGLFEVTTDYLLKGNTQLIQVSTANGFIPLVAVSAHAGYVENLHENFNFEDQDWYKIPGFNPLLDQKLFEVEGESMVPTIFPHDILICQVQPNIRNILSGTLLLVITNKAVLIKRLQRIEDNEVVVINDNPKEPEEMKISLSEIQQVLIVSGKITGMLVPHHQVVSQGKMQALEDSVDLLKKEMFTLNKKLQALKR